MSSVSAAHQEPTIVLVEGRFSDGHLPWREITPQLQEDHRNAGAVVIYGLRATSAIATRELFDAVHTHIPRIEGANGLVALGTHVAKASGDKHSESNAKICRLAPWQERRAKELLESNFAGRITLAELASACELSVRHFTRAFRGSTGTSPHAWLLRLRLEKAMKLLANSARDLVDIAIDCGFADQSHLTRVFQRFVGTSPGAWRRLHRL